MSITNKNFKLVIEKAMPEIQKFGFSENAAEQKADAITFCGEHGVLMISYENEKVEMYLGDDAETPSEAPNKVSTSLLNANADDRDIKYVVGEIGETLNEKFGVKTVSKARQNAATKTVSKNAIKKGLYYDASTLASKLCLIYPEIRDEYKANIDKYDEFLGEEFFDNHATALIMKTIKENKPEMMKKLFQVLNEIYEDGTNDTQSLIAVTIMGHLDNDVNLLANCVDYMSEAMAPPVIEVNKYLKTVGGKKAKKLLKNPPAYKPKKVKKPGMFAQAMAQSGGAPMPPM